MLKFLLASGNNHKALEFAQLFNGDFIKIDAAIHKIEIEENGDTFLENSYLKAKAYYDFFKIPTMSDDSGLCVEALPEKLGIHTARYGGADLNDEQRARLLIEEMKEFHDINQRQAYFICQLCFYLNTDEIFYFEGRLEGRISFDYRGNNGFGYDPIFIPNKISEEKTLAEIPKWKSCYSHRCKAVEQAEKFLKEFRKL